MFRQRRFTHVLSLLALSACGAHGSQGNASSAQASTHDDKSAAASIVGAWKLARLDNVQPADVPPWGPVAMVYVFWPDGRSKHYLPGQSRDHVVYGRGDGDTPFKEYVPYKVEGSRLHGWLGLTIDFDPVQTVTFAAADQLLVTYADGSVATLERISTDPDRYDDPVLPCAGLSAAQNYDAEFVAYLRRAARLPADQTLARTLVGQWKLPKEATAMTSIEFRDGEEIQHPTPAELAAQPQFALVINGDGTLGLAEEGVRDVELTGRYELRGDVLMQHTEECGAWTRVKVEDGALKLTGDGKNWQTFPRAR